MKFGSFGKQQKILVIFLGLRNLLSFSGFEIFEAYNF